MHRLILASVVLLLGGAPAADAACVRAAGERVVARSDAAVVTVRTAAQGGRRWVGCLRETGAAIALGGSLLDALERFLAVARPDGSVVVLDAATGAPAGPPVPPGPERASAKLDRSGAAAVLHAAPGGEAVLRLLRPGAEPEVVDRGPIRWFQVLDGRLTWRARGRNRSVTL